MLDSNGALLKNNKPKTEKLENMAYKVLPLVITTLR